MPERTHDPEKVKEEFFAQGYSLVEDAVEPEMVDRLEAAARRVWAKVRAGEVDVAGNGPEATAIFGVIAPGIWGAGLCRALGVSVNRALCQDFLGAGLAHGARAFVVRRQGLRHGLAPRHWGGQSGRRRGAGNGAYHPADDGFAVAIGAR